MKRIIAAAVLAVIGTTSVASAADMATKAPMYKAPAAVVSDWTGFYIGAHGGYGWSNQNDWQYYDCCGSSTPSNIPIGQGKLNGGLAGGQIGYNWQTGSYVLGLQADGSWADIKGTAGNPLNLIDGRCAFPGIDDQSAACRTTYKAMFNFTGRAGYLITPSTLIYGKAGINVSSIDFKVLNDVDVNGGTCGPIGSTYPGYNTVNRTRAGFTAGAGIEQRISDRLTIFGEYDYADVGGTALNAYTGGTGPSGCTRDFRATTTTKGLNIVKGGINYSFGGPIVAKY
jgi:outer membrane immunogenic protein